MRCRIEAAARSAGRDPAGVRLICVTKGIYVGRIREAIAYGVTDIGENRVQEAQQKKENMSAGYRVPGTLRWHLIGRLQRNKARIAAQIFDVVHSVDSLELVAALERQAALRRAVRPELKSKDERLAQGERRMEALIQVNVSGEATKGGCRPEEVQALAEALNRSRSLRLAGLMTMAPYAEDPERARPVFRRLREIRDRLEDQLGDCFAPLHGARNDVKSRLHLSMGMSQDFEAAVQEGATMVRIGTAIFGERV